MHYTLRKVPQIAALFWIIKLCTTAMGESTSDYLVTTVDPYIAVAGSFVVFGTILWLQFRAPKYIPWLYWLSVLMVAVFGTMAADVIHVVLGVPYIVSTVGFAIALCAIFLLWWYVERSLSIHTITTPRRELFYWATVLATFALGTAAGDLFAYSLYLGFLDAGLIFIAMFAIPGIGYRLLKWKAIASFWAAYILTRPIGASFADWTGKAQAVGGLGWGDGVVAALLLGVIVILVGYLQLTHIDEDLTRIQKNNQS